MDPLKWQVLSSRILLIILACFIVMLFISIVGCQKCVNCTDTTRTVDRAGNEKPVQKDQYQDCEENNNGKVAESRDKYGTWTQTKTECK